MKVLTVTGYKPIEMNIFKANDHKIDFIKQAIKKRLIQYVEEGLEWVLMSGQMGVELWTSEVIMELKENYDIKFGLIPPFENQDKNWPEPYQMLLEEASMFADFHQTLYKDEYKGPYQFKARDKWLIEKSDACLILLDEEFPGSTRFFLDEAKRAGQKKHYPILTITPLDLEDAVQEIQNDQFEH
ncbi:SLOG family protein [Aquibacillus koreensis]|uniref:SLOG family protein n=1 Tax=Aquibacillus koreensis TaxID=279446 RepID=A0A9X3WHN4_9BACI|nr:SLOG family protein [Aquibacillus koreensis]MCT2537342.1 SLOG family protein [Aquibacillus koreensis]MDC3418788.1 SLOG family protein [Aquibacillus koreensis]